MVNQEVQLLQNFEKDSEWFHKNTNFLRERGFTGKFVAIKENKVISSGENVDNLIVSLENQGKNPSYLFIEFVYPEGFTLLL